MTTAANLVNTLFNQGKLAEAETMLRETLAVQRRVLGPENPQTLWTAERLAFFMRSAPQRGKPCTLIQACRQLAFHPVTKLPLIRISTRISTRLMTRAVRRSAVRP